MTQAWEAWPVCPQCGKRRQAVCPLCQNSSDRFSLGYYQAEELPRGYDGSPPQPLPHDVWLMCDVCTEAFRPSFYARCEACNYDFGEGAHTEDFEREDQLSQMSAASFGAALIVAAVLLYWFVLI